MWSTFHHGLGATKAPDAVAHVTRELNGQILKVHSPPELAQAIRKIEAQLAPSRERLAALPASIAMIHSRITYRHGPARAFLSGV